MLNKIKLINLNKNVNKLLKTIIKLWDFLDVNVNP